VEPEPSDKLTPQQRAAVTRRDVSVVLSSGAGCGKTHVLTQRYLSHLREGVEVGQVVAITFTDRAARQMRARIRKAIVAHLRAAATDADADRWARHLRGLETAQISTIHALCGTLLRQYAVEAGLDPRFDVLEDVLSVNLEAEALTACLQRLLVAQDQAGDDLRQLVVLYGWNPVVAAVEQLLHAWDEEGWIAWVGRPAADIAREWQEHARQVLLPRYLAHLTVAEPKIARCLHLLRNRPPLPGSQMAENVRLLQEGLLNLPTVPDLAAAVEALNEAAKVGRHGAKAWPNPDEYQAAREALEDFRGELRGQHLEALAADPDEVAAAVEIGQRFLRVAADAVRTYRDTKRQHSVVDFQDLLILARDLLRDHAEVRARLHERYRYLLIDELQDTDPVQVQLVEYLCGGGLTAGKLFAVGDWKQSIYRFRGADAHLFRALRQRVPHDGRLGLTVNFRSQPAVLDFVNALMARHMQDYEPLEPHHAQVSPGPCVEFLWSPRGDRDSVTEARRQEADWIARRIALMVGHEELVVERGEGAERLRPVRRGDVVLLFRAMSNVHLYEAALRQHGLDYYLVGGRAFFAQQEIYDLLNLLRALENPQDAVSLAGTLRSPFCCVSDESLFVLSGGPNGLWAGLHDPERRARVPEDQRAAVDRACRSLDAWRALKDRLPIALLLGRVFADSGYDAATQFEFLGDRKLANLWKLLDLARTFDRSGLFGLAEFIARLGDLVRTQPREEQAATQPEDADVVRLMTIHQAKGLEFPVVFVPDVAATGHDAHSPVARWDARLGCVARPPADEDPPPFPDFGLRLWQAAERIEEWHEDLRTLYVACTRTEDYLVLSAALPKPYRPTKGWMMTLADRFDLDTGACRAADCPSGRMPQVRVVDAPAAPEQPAVAGSRGVPSVVAEGTDGVLPVPVRLAGKRIFTVAEVGCLLRSWESTNDAGLTARDVAFQYDAEDGSDRNVWATDREELGCPRDAEELALDRVLRGVLSRWDFRHPDGWRVLLLQELQTSRVADTESSLARCSGEILARFAGSEMCRRLAVARQCHRDVEFLTDWPDGEGAGLRGVMDSLWQDAMGGWHLLAFDTRSDLPPDDDSWGGRKPALVLSAWAAERHLGTGVKSVSLFHLATGTARTCAARSFGRRRVLTAAGSALKDCARQLLQD
jgi:ATP-dependent helicase/nuclease subunit A